MPRPALTLCAREDGYEVVNIVPLETDELGVSGYNDILNDFIERVVGPASREIEFDVAVTPRKQSITDWTSDEVASALHTFSVCANKSTGAGHPADRKRWFEFLFAAHAANTLLDTELLGRWLVEAEEWPPEVAYDLVDRYQPYRFYQLILSGLIARDEFLRISPEIRHFPAPTQNDSHRFVRVAHTHL